MGDKKSSSNEPDIRIRDLFSPSPTLYLSGMKAPSPKPASKPPSPSNSMLLKSSNVHKNMEDLKQQVIRLKSELEAEKARYKQLQRDKALEMKQLKESQGKEKERLVMANQMKMQQEKQAELQKQKDSLNKEKMQEIQQLLKERDEHIRQLRCQNSLDKDESVKVALEMQKKVLEEQQSTNQKPASNSTLIIKLQREIKSLKDSKKDLEEQLDLKSASDAEKSAQMKLMQDEHGIQIEKIVQQYKNEAKHDLELLKKKLEEFENNKNITNSDQNDLGTNDLQNDLDKGNHQNTDNQLMRQENIEVPSKDDDTDGISKSARPVLKELPNSEEENDNAKTRILVDDKEKERQLHRKVTDLNSQVNRLEKRVTVLKSENDQLKKKSEEQKPSEEKIKKLKKRNAELAAIARRLEEKAKQLQNENVKRSRESPREDSEVVKKSVAKQRSRDLADQGKLILEKNKEIENLRSKVHGLLDELATVQTSSKLQNPEFYQEQGELENIIKQAAKERLQLEKQLTYKKVSENADITRIQILEQTNDVLRQEVEKLTEENKAAERLEIEVTQRRIECENLYKEIDDARSKCANLAGDLQSALDRNHDLLSENEELHGRLHELERVNEECQYLRETLSQVEQDCQAARAEVGHLQAKVHTLEQAIQHLQEEAGRYRELEVEHAQLTQKLHQREQQLNMLSQAKEEAKKQHEEAIEGLQSKLRELERKYELQAIKHEELTLEMTQLRHQAERAKTSPNTSALNNDTSAPKMLNGSSRPHSRSSNHELDSVLSEAMLSDIIPFEEEAELSRDDPDGHMTFEEEQGQTDLPVEDIVIDLEGVHKILPSPQSAGIRELTPAKIERSPSGLSLNLDKKSPFQVYVAKYSYDPLQFSPNENPEAELVLNAGDYIFVYGEMDEDGFFEGETVDGRRGLVPSNFIEKVPDEDLDDLQMTSGQAEDNSMTGSFHQDLDFNSGDESDKVKDQDKLKHSDGKDLHPKDYDDVDVESISVAEVQLTGIPAPRNLQLDRQLANSVVISWSHPENMGPADVQAYHIDVDGVFKTSVKGTERTKALLEGVKSTMTHRIAIRTVTKRGQSRDLGAALLIGKDVSLAPTDLKVTNLTSTTATLTWLPSNSDYEHVVAVNSVDKKAVSPGCCCIRLDGLSPGKRHQVSVRPSNSPSDNDNSNNVACISLTTPTGGIPDAPLDLQLETGPREGTLLATWLPVTINPAGTSNGALVCGYALYADGQKIKEIKSPTGDHAVLQTSDFMNCKVTPKELTIRTLSEEKESPDSKAVLLSEQLVKEVVVPAKKSDRQPVVNKPSPQPYPLASSPFGSVNQPSKPLQEGQQYTEQKRGSPVSHPQVMPSRSPVVPPSDQVAPPHGMMTSTPTPELQAHPIQTDHPQSRTPPRGAESPPQPRGEARNISPSDPAMSVPHIEITKDSSGSMSTSGGENMTDDDMESAVSSMTSSKPSPITPDQKFDTQQRPEGARSPFEHNWGAPEGPRGLHHPVPHGAPPGSPYGPPEPLHGAPPGPPHYPQAPFGAPHGPIPPHGPPHLHGSPHAPHRELPGPMYTTHHGPNAGPPHGAPFHIMSPHGAPPHGPLPHGPNPAEPPPPGPPYGPPPGPPHGPPPGPPHGPPPGPPHGPPPGPPHGPPHGPGYGQGPLAPTPSKSPPVMSSKRRDYIEPEHRKDVEGGEQPQFHELRDNNEISPRKIRDDIPDAELIDYEDEGEGESLVDEADMYNESIVRVFIALFDYDPSVMSPNPDALDEELPFKEGQLIKIFGEQDPDGFYLGEAYGRRGLVPGNMVSEVQVDDPEVALQLLNESNRMQTPGQGTSGHTTPAAPTPGRHTPGRPVPDDGSAKHPVKPAGEPRRNEPIDRPNPLEQRRTPDDWHPAGEERHVMNRRPSDDPPRGPDRSQTKPNKTPDSAPSPHRERREMPPHRDHGRHTPNRDVMGTPEINHHDRADRPLVHKDRDHDIRDRDRDLGHRDRDSSHRDRDQGHRDHERDRNYRDRERDLRDKSDRDYDRSRPRDPSRDRHTPADMGGRHTPGGGRHTPSNRHTPSHDHRDRHHDRDHRERESRRDSDGRRDADGHRDSRRESDSRDRRRRESSSGRDGDRDRRGSRDRRSTHDHRDRDRDRRSEDSRRPNGVSPRSRSSSRQGRARSTSPNGVPPIPADGAVQHMVAMYDYDPVQLSPNVDAEVELSFKTGDVIVVFGEMDDDGFFMGEIHGRRGLVPSNFLQPVSAADLEKMQGHKGHREAKNSSPAKDKTSSSSPAKAASSDQQSQSSNTPSKPQGEPTSIPPGGSSTSAATKGTVAGMTDTEEIQEAPETDERMPSPTNMITFEDFGPAKDKERKKSIFSKGKSIFRKFSKS